MSSPVLSRSVEDYLKAVYALNSRGRAAETGQLARALDVQPASVSGMIRRLASDGLVDHEPYRGARLTEEGMRLALKVLRRHRILETFLVSRLGYGWDDVHEEAERLEHTASDALIERMAEVLGDPATDPHGAPIPTRAGRMDATPWRPLDEVPLGRRAVVRSVPDDDPDRLRRFQAMGLVPGARLDVASTDGAARVFVRVEGDAGIDVVALSADVAKRVTVWDRSDGP